MRSRARGLDAERETKAQAKARGEPLRLLTRAQREAAEKKERSPASGASRGSTRRALDPREEHAGSPPESGADWGRNDEESHSAQSPLPGFGNAAENTEEAHHGRSPASGLEHESDSGSAGSPRVALGLMVANCLTRREGQLSPEPRSWGTRPCREFAKGHCAFGNGCRYRHFSSEDPSSGDLRAMELGALHDNGLVCPRTKVIVPTVITESGTKFVPRPTRQESRAFWDFTEGRAQRGTTPTETIKPESCSIRKRKDDAEPVARGGTGVASGATGSGGGRETSRRDRGRGIAGPGEQSAGADSSVPARLGTRQDAESHEQRERGSPFPQPNYAKAGEAIAAWAKGGAGIIAAAGLATPAEGAAATFTCTAADSVSRDEERQWWAVVAFTTTVVIAIAAAFALGRWSKGRLPIEGSDEHGPWFVVTETQAAPVELPRGARRQDVRWERPVVRKVASQAPCTYTTVRGHARGRFQPLPESAHG